MTLSLRELVRDRWRKQTLYSTAAYWDRKAEAYRGLARSNWPSNTYNRFVHERQMGLIDQLVGDVRDLSVADVGCGTGRAALHLARRGAKVTGIDFSPKALEVARADAGREGLDVHFELGNLLEQPRAELRGRFDWVLALGCLCLACQDQAALGRALGHLVGLLATGGRLLLLEPIHSSRLLRRILALNTQQWIEQCDSAGLQLVDRGGAMFVPVRLLLAFRDWPGPLTRAAFHAGERVLAWSPRLECLADYKWLLCQRAGAGRNTGS
ncbi:class I SAM-dependent methyltransferase [Myxococcota bacterium]